MGMGRWGGGGGNGSGKEQFRNKDLTVEVLLGFSQTNATYRCSFSKHSRFGLLKFMKDHQISAGIQITEGHQGGIQT